VQNWDNMKRNEIETIRDAAQKVERVLADLLGCSSVALQVTKNGQTLLVRIDEGSEYLLHELGSGLAQLIWLVITLATTEASIVFIDEPETHLHPAMQSRLIDFAQGRAGFCLAFSTHSVGLARQKAQHIYSVSKAHYRSPSVVRLFADPKSAAELLGELSYSQFANLNGKAILLVEGPSEIAVFRRWLQFYRLDHEVLLIPLGGSTGIRARPQEMLGEFQRFGCQVYVVFDSERTKDDESLNETRESFRKSAEIMFGSGNVLCTERRATENYFSDSAVRSVKGVDARALAPYEKLGRQWQKNENWQTVQAMGQAELQGTDIGDFLQRMAKNILAQESEPSP
jgi:predicted ATP-dependent endonuclease of OLD family